MNREERTNLVFLDACRNNPLANTLARSLRSRSASVGRGLARVETGLGMMIAYATSPGTVALDGERSFSVNPGQRLEVEIRRNGPPVVQVDAALRLAAELGLFRS